MRNFFPLMDASAGANGGGGQGGGQGGQGGQNGGQGQQGGQNNGGQGGQGGQNGGQPVAWHAGFFKPDGAIDHAALERLPDNYKPLSATLATLKTGDDLLAKIQNLNALAGRKGLAPLPANATADDVAAQQAVLRAVLGVPEKPDGYGIKRPDNIPEGSWDEKYSKTASELMHKHNASPALVKGLMEMQAAKYQADVAAQQTMEQEWFTGQDNEFREAIKKTGDDYDKVMATVGQMATKFGMAADSPVLKNAQVRLMLHEVAKAIAEPATRGGQGGDTNTKSDQAIADAIVHDKSNPDYEAYWNPAHAKNAEVKKRVMGLYESAAKQAHAAQQGGARR